ncbi:MAG: WD40 repeat domain-containing serine/threonine protein kinase [Gemmataceae bacterium]
MSAKISPPSSPAAAPLRPELENLLYQFDQQWRQPGQRPRVEDFLASATAELSPGERRFLLEETIKIDLEYRWRSGRPEERMILEDYVRRLPELGRPGAELIGAEYWVRLCWGDRPAHDEYLQRFAEQRTALPALLSELDQARQKEQGRKQASPAEVPAPPPTLARSSELAAKLDELGLLPTERAAQLKELAGKFPEARALGRELLQREWLTPFQVNQLLQGRDDELVLGPYHLLERLGEGSIGQVYKAHQHALERIVALKVLRKELASEPEAVGRFQREVRLISQLTHPNIVHAYDAGQVGSVLVLAMEFIEGTDLARMVKRGGPLPAGQACDYIRQAALGLQYAHEQGLVHRDIKPHNLLVTARSEVKLLDLGLARLRSHEDAATIRAVEHMASSLTPVGAIMMGTVDYMAPEQAIDFHQADIRADIYSLGCTFFYLLAGQPPFASAGSLAEKLAKHLHTPPPDLESLRQDLPEGLPAIVNKMLAKKPEGRFQEPREVAEALAELAGQQPSRWRTVRYWLKRRTPRRVAAASLLLACLGLALNWLLSSGSTPTLPTGIGPGGQPSPGSFAQLDADMIPAKKRFAGQPAELVGIFGERSSEAAVSVAISPDGGLLAAGYDSGLIRLFEPSTGNEVGRLNGHSSPVKALAFAPGRPWLASAADERHVSIWDLDKKSELTWIAIKGSKYRDLQFSRDGNLFVYANNDATIRVFETGTWREKYNLTGCSAPIFSVCFSPDATLLATASWDRSGRIWDLATSRELQRFTLPGQGSIDAIRFAPDGRTVALTWGMQVKSYNVANGAEKSAARGPAYLTSLAYLPDGTRLLGAGRVIHRTGDNGWLGQYYPDSDRPTQATFLPTIVNGLALAPDGRHVATANGEGTVYILRLSR